MGHTRDQSSTLVDETVTQEWREPRLPTAFSHSHEKHEAGLRALPWLEVDFKSQSGRMVELPTRETIPIAAEEQLIVELYSK